VLVDRQRAQRALAIGENSVSITGFVAKVPTATRSSGSFARRNAWAAATAFAKGWPFIDCERSTHSATLFARLRFSACMLLTGLPFSVTRGDFVTGTELTSVIRTRGYEVASRPETLTPAAAVGTAASAAAPRAIPTLMRICFRLQLTAAPR
jgi:hypothetical protein